MRKVTLVVGPRPRQDILEVEADLLRKNSRYFQARIPEFGDAECIIYLFEVDILILEYYILWAHTKETRSDLDDIYDTRLRLIRLYELARRFDNAVLQDQILHDIQSHMQHIDTSTLNSMVHEVDWSTFTELGRLVIKSVLAEPDTKWLQSRRDTLPRGFLAEMVLVLAGNAAKGQEVRDDDIVWHRPCKVTELPLSVPKFSLKRRLVSWRALFQDYMKREDRHMRESWC